MAGTEEPTESAAPGDPTSARRRRRRRRSRGGRGRGGASTTATSKDTTAQPSAGAQPTPSADRVAQPASKKRRRKKPAGSTAVRASGGARTVSKGGATPRGRKIPTTREVSAGGVVYRRTDGGVEVVLASRRTRRGQLAWGLAKGGIEDGESKEQAAIREVREETGLKADIEVDLGDTKYMYVWDDIRIRKTVHFFLMRHTGGDVDDRDDEMEEIRWFPMERAIKRAAYRGERDMLVKASELLR